MKADVMMNGYIVAIWVWRFGIVYVMMNKCIVKLGAVSTVYLVTLFAVVFVSLKLFLTPRMSLSLFLPQPPHGNVGRTARHSGALPCGMGGWLRHTTCLRSETAFEVRL